MRSLSSLSVTAQRALALSRGIPRSANAVRGVASSSTQNKASSAIPIQEHTAAEDLHEANHSMHAVEGKLDRYVLAKFGPYGKKDLVPDLVDMNEYNRANDQFRMWAGTVMMLTCLVTCLGMVTFAKLLPSDLNTVDHEHHTTPKLDNQRAQAHLALNPANPKQ